MDNLKKINLSEGEPGKPTQNLPADQAEDGSITVPKLGGKPNADKRKRKKPKFSPRVGLALKILVIFLVFVLGFALISGIQLLSVYKDVSSLRSTMTSLETSVAGQDIVHIKKDIKNLQEDVAELQDSYAGVAWMRILPLVGKYVEDGSHGLYALEHGLNSSVVVLEAVEPYADILGFAKEGAPIADGEQTAQERLDFVVQTLPDLLPKMDELSTEMAVVQSEIAYIDPNDYPEEFRGIAVRDQMKRGLLLVNSAAELVTSGKPLLERAPYLLGTDETRRYLILFQNDKELRPTGGFITAYSIAQVTNARFEPVYSDDIYNLDARYTPAIPASEPVIKYIKGPYLSNLNYQLRDINWSPDFSESMDLFVREAGKVGIDDIDGVIGVDTQLLVNILDALGPVEVPGFGQFSTELIPECNCPQVVYELESFADVEGAVIFDPLTGDILQAPANIDNRKKIIGPLMNSVLANALGSSKEKIPALFEAGFKSLIEKNVVIYMLDEESQQAVESFGIAGRIENTDGDYLHVNDANLGGRKSNLYVTSEVVQNIDIERDGSITKTLELTYKNPQKHDGWLNSVLPNYVRIYVPEGSELLDASGFDETDETYDELGKTVFAGFFELRPQGVSKVTLTYKLPFTTEDDYHLLIQKQPGANLPLYKVNIGKIEDEFFLNSDKDLQYSI
ncbi:DUF4012 domain-containing protein [Patescibacteria group bacterium]